MFCLQVSWRERSSCHGLIITTGLTDGAVFSVVSGARAVTLILFLSMSYTNAPVLTGNVTAWVDCGVHKKKKKTQEKEAGNEHKDDDQILPVIIQD